MSRHPSTHTRLTDADLDALAVTAGRDWAAVRVRELAEQDRQVAGGWPGTLREAKAQVLAALSKRGAGAPTVEQLDGLARTATAAARAAASRRNDEPLRCRRVPRRARWVTVARAG